MVQSALLRKPSLIAPPSSIWEVPLSVEGWSSPSTTNLVLTVAESQCTGLYRAGYHKGCCLWGVGSSYTDATQADIRQQRGAEKRKRARKEREEGGKTTFEVEDNTGKEKRGWMEREGRRQWWKVWNGPNVSSPVLLHCSLSLFLVSHLCSCCLHVNSLLHICLYDCGANFYSTFDISVAALAHSRPWWINLTFGSVVLFTFDRIYTVWSCCCHTGQTDVALLTITMSMFTWILYARNATI